LRNCINKVIVLKDQIQREVEFSWQSTREPNWKVLLRPFDT